MLCISIAIWGYWQFVNPVELWRDFAGTDVVLVGAAGAIVGFAIYIFEGLREKLADKPTLSDILFLVSAISAIVWWIISTVELTERIGGPVPAEVVFYSGILTAVSFDIARRIVGPVIPLIGFLFFIYSFEPIAQALPGLLNHPGFPLHRAERMFGFYFWKLFVPLSLIVAMASIVFWIDPQNLGPQLGVSTASVFTLIAFLISMGRHARRRQVGHVADPPGGWRWSRSRDPGTHSGSFDPRFSRKPG